MPRAVSRPAINPWFVAAAVVVPTFMEVLDTTIANVALRYIAGGLSASNVDSEWVLTSYLAANATILPISGWISAHLGRRNYFLLSIAVFTIASGLCGMATSLGQLILFRVIQGLAGGGLQPSSQGVLLDSFPPEKQGDGHDDVRRRGLARRRSSARRWAAISRSPTTGAGSSTSTSRWAPSASWRLTSWSMTLITSRRERAELRRQPLNFDYHRPGAARPDHVVLGSHAQQGAGVGLVQRPVLAGADAVHPLRSRAGRLDLPGAADRQPSSQLPAAGRAKLRGLLHHHLLCVRCALRREHIPAGPAPVPVRLRRLCLGLVQSPSGIFSIMMLVVVGALIGRGVDARWLIAAGLLVMAAGNYWMALMNLYISPWQVIWPRVVLIVGLSMIFAPINVAAFKYTPMHLRGAAVGLMALLRNEGGSVGTSMAQTIEHRREQFHTARVGEFLDPFNPAVNSFSEQGQAFFFQQTGDPAGSQQMTWQALADLRQQQAASLAYFDVFWLFAVLAVGLLVLVPLMKRSVAQEGEHIGAE